MEVINSIPQQRMHKKISIQQFQFPKLRHKSIHNINQKLRNLLQKKQMKSTLQRHKQQNTTCQIYSLHKSKYNKHSKSLSRVEQNMLIYRQQYKQITIKNKKLLNQTFFKFHDQNIQIQKKKKLQKKKVFNMEKTQHLQSSVDNSLIHKQNHFHQKNHNNLDFNLQKLKKSQDLYTGPLIVLDYKIQMSFLNHLCFDGQFPLARVGATLSFNNQQIYLFGGCPDSIQGNILVFHKYYQEQSCWKHVKSIGQKPYLSLMYHTSNSYKDYFVFTGGICLQKFQIKKLNNPHINIYNTITSSWSQLNWGYYLKHHTSCMINNVLIIHGGINQRQRTQNKLHFIHLNFSSNLLPYSKIVTYNSNQYLSHHKMITTIGQDSRLRSKFKTDGIFMFGGKKHIQQKLSNQLYYMESNSFRLNDDDTSILKKWQIAQIKGPKPQPRMCHSFDLLMNKGLCVLIGGINQKNQYLNDMWIFDLFGLTWTKVEQVPLLRQTGGIAYHSTVVNQSQIYLYGGLTKNHTNKQFYLIQTQKFKRNLSRHQSRKRVQASSNMISFKAFQ